MNILVDNHNIYNFNPFICEPFKNNIIQDGFFRRILFSNDTLITNNICINIPLDSLKIKKWYNKHKCVFDNIYILNSVIEYEKYLLGKLLYLGKIPNYTLFDQLSSNNLKITLLKNININDGEIKDINNVNLVIKISGIWETDTDYGITIKCFI
jgi:hypothetical protein